MRIKAVHGQNLYRVVSSVRSREDAAAREQLAIDCAALSPASVLFYGIKTDYPPRLSESIGLLEMAIEDARNAETLPFSLQCNSEGCEDSRAALAQLDTRSLWQHVSGCNPPQGDAMSCHTFQLEDTTGQRPRKSWTVNIVAERVSARHVQVRDVAIGNYYPPVL
jgi:hypothetical protein